VYAIIEDGGRQYKVEEGQVLDVDLRPVAEGADTIEFDRVLLVGEGADAKVGTPVVDGAKVLAKIQDNVKGPKLDMLHFIRRKGHCTHKGHRQKYIRVQIEKIVS
jgi:large subunit ribosomal protein L21